MSRKAHHVRIRKNKLNYIFSSFFILLIVFSVIFVTNLIKKGQEIKKSSAATCNTCYNFNDSSNQLVDIQDVVSIANRWNITSADPNYSDIYDIYCSSSTPPDGSINVLDLQTVANNWNTTSCTPSTGPTTTPSAYSCGNGTCESGETCGTCPGDCPGVCNLDHKAICGAQKEGLDPGRFNLSFNNPWLPFPVGLVNEMTDGFITVRVSVLNETEVVNGVVTRVIEEREWEGSNLVEVSRNYFAESPDRNVCYFGEWVDEYSGGIIVGHGGSWRSDQSDSWAGVMMPSDPRVGMTWLIEDAAAHGAYEDGVVKSIGNSWSTHWGTIQNALHISEDNDSSQKRYARCLGMIYDDGIDLSSTTQSGECP